MSKLTDALDRITVGDLRRVLNSGDQTRTLAEALASLAAADAASAAHAASSSRYEAYTRLREQRRTAAIEKAAQAAHDATDGGDGNKMAARQQARTEAFYDFEAREPLLDFAAWEAAGSPDTYTLNVVQRAARTLSELVS